MDFVAPEDTLFHLYLGLTWQCPYLTPCTAGGAWRDPHLVPHVHVKLEVPHVLQQGCARGGSPSSLRVYVLLTHMSCEGLASQCQRASN